jgi:hypothetical protein
MPPCASSPRRETRQAAPPEAPLSPHLGSASDSVARPDDRNRAGGEPLVDEPLTPPPSIETRCRSEPIEPAHRRPTPVRRGTPLGVETPLTRPATAIDARVCGRAARSHLGRLRCVPSRACRRRAGRSESTTLRPRRLGRTVAGMAAGRTPIRRGRPPQATRRGNGVYTPGGRAGAGSTAEHLRHGPRSGRAIAGTPESDRACSMGSPRHTARCRNVVDAPVIDTIAVRRVRARPGLGRAAPTCPRGTIFAAGRPEGADLRARSFDRFTPGARTSGPGRRPLGGPSRNTARRVNAVSSHGSPLSSQRPEPGPRGQQ